MHTVCDGMSHEAFEGRRRDTREGDVIGGDSSPDLPRRLGTVAQRRHARTIAHLESGPPNVPLPDTPTSVATSSELDFAFQSSTRSSLDPAYSPGSSPTPGKYSISLQSFDMDNFTVPDLPEPHIPMRKSSATVLQKMAYHNQFDGFMADAESPTIPVFPVRTSSRTHSPRLLRDQQVLTPELDNVFNSPVSDPAVFNALPHGRPRGLTTDNSRTPDKQNSHFRSPSIPDISAKARVASSSLYKPERGPSSRDVSLTYRQPPPVPWKETEEGRTSVRSAVTNASNATYVSSGCYEPSETEERSSIATRSSSVSNLSRRHLASLQDEEFDVDDVFALYANGFADDEVVQRSSKVSAVDEASSEHPLETSASALGTVDYDEPDPKRPAKLVTVFKNNDHDDVDSGFARSPTTHAFPPSPLLSHPVNPLDQIAMNSPLQFAQSHDSVSPVEDERDELPDGFPFNLNIQRSFSPPSPVTIDPIPTPQSHKETMARLEQPAPSPRDRYGFKKTTQYITAEEYDAWDSKYTEYLERRKTKWEVMMMQWSLPIKKPTRFPAKSDKVKRYIRKGIPPDWRGACWFWYAGGPERVLANPGLYERLVAQADAGELNEVDGEIIERDLNRTFPDNEHFKPDHPELAGPRDSSGELTGLGLVNAELPIIKALRRVLQAFAIHNPNIGYCQSLNFLAGLLLLFVKDEEKVFHMLNIITTVHLPGTHAKVLETNVDVGVLMTCIKESMPQVWAKIDDIHKGRGAISTTRLPTVSLATTAWFMSCFIGNLPIETVLRVWDSFFYEGSKTLFRIALAIFKTGETEIRTVNEHMEVFQIVQAIPRRLLDANALMQNCYKRRNGFGHLSQDVIDSRRKERRTALQKEREVKAEPADPTAEDRPPRPRGRGTLRRAASKAMLRGKSRNRSPVQEPMPASPMPTSAPMPVQT